MIQTANPCYSKRERERESYSLEDSISKANVVCDGENKAVHS